MKAINNLLDFCIRRRRVRNTHGKDIKVKCSIPNKFWCSAQEQTCKIATDTICSRKIFLIKKQLGKDFNVIFLRNTFKSSTKNCKSGSFNAGNHCIKLGYIFFFYTNKAFAQI